MVSKKTLFRHIWNTLIKYFELVHISLLVSLLLINNRKTYVMMKRITWCGNCTEGMARYKITPCDRNGLNVQCKYKERWNLLQDIRHQKWCTLKVFTWKNIVNSRAPNDTNDSNSNNGKPRMANRKILTRAVVYVTVASLGCSDHTSLIISLLFFFALTVTFIRLQSVISILILRTVTRFHFLDMCELLKERRLFS